jgi:3-oxoacyl-[acyl-carrier protein] reductase
MPAPLDFADKVVLVTGATRGIGRAIALGFARGGAIMAINGRSKETIQKMGHEVETFGRRAMCFKADVSKSEQVNHMVSDILKKMRRIDILVNNAGIYEIVSIRQMTEERWDRMMETNLKGTYNCTKAVIETMIKQRYGKIVNLGSIAGKTGSVLPLAHYAASKAGVMCFTKSIARELAPYGINVNCVCPGVIETDMTIDIVDDKEKQIPLGIGIPEDVANAVLFLASEKARYITGEIMDVNGGLLMD